MSDEIEQANVVRLEHTPGDPVWTWRARIGPADGRGLEGRGRTAPEALWALGRQCERLGWPFDESWRDRG